MTGMPLRPSEGPACRVHLEGRACHVRRATLDHPLRFRGHDRRAPPTLEGPARRVREITLDNAF
jgi:hypothetical protein